ncbi:hypothetical protein HZA44_02030, partial [Candidatus Peregrinibacteria bacterium]|nr:hypothetical protein [Candidatus Peregrinibacteria bacterium]
GIGGSYGPGEWEKESREVREMILENRKFGHKRAERRAHDEDLLEGGSEIVDVGQKSSRMVVTPEQIEKARKQMQDRLS